MTGEVVNLRLMRKRRDRASREEAAATKRAKHGRTKAEKAVEAASREGAKRVLDGHRLDDD